MEQGHKRQGEVRVAALVKLNLCRASCVSSESFLVTTGQEHARVDCGSALNIGLDLTRGVKVDYPYTVYFREWRSCAGSGWHYGVCSRAILAEEC